MSYHFWKKKTVLTAFELNWQDVLALRQKLVLPQLTLNSWLLSRCNSSADSTWPVLSLVSKVLQDIMFTPCWKPGSVTKKVKANPVTPQDRGFQWRQGEAWDFLLLPSCIWQYSLKATNCLIPYWVFHWLRPPKRPVCLDTRRVGTCLILPHRQSIASTHQPLQLSQGCTQRCFSFRTESLDISHPLLVSQVPVRCVQGRHQSHAAFF